MKTLPYSFIVLEYVGGWKPLEWSTNIKGKLYDIYALTITLAMSTFCVSCVIDLFYTENIEDIVHNMSWSFTLIVVCSKLALLTVKRNKIINIIKLLDINICRVRCAKEANIQFKYDEKAKFVLFFSAYLKYYSLKLMSLFKVFLFYHRNLVKKYGGLVCCAVFAITGASILENIPTKTLPFNGWVPYRHDYSTGFWVAYFHQMITLSITSMIGFSFDTVVYGILLQNCSQLKILKTRLENFVEIVDEEKLNNKVNGSSLTIRECEHKFIKQCIHHLLMKYLFDTLSVRSTANKIGFHESRVYIHRRLSRMYVNPNLLVLLVWQRSNTRG